MFFCLLSQIESNRTPSKHRKNGSKNHLDPHHPEGQRGRSGRPYDGQSPCSGVSQRRGSAGRCSVADRKLSAMPMEALADVGDYVAPAAACTVLLRAQGIADGYGCLLRQRGDTFIKKPPPGCEFHIRAVVFVGKLLGQQSWIGPYTQILKCDTLSIFFKPVLLCFIRRIYLHNCCQRKRVRVPGIALRSL